MARQGFNPQQLGEITSYDPREVGGGRTVKRYDQEYGDRGTVISGGPDSPEELNRYRGMGEAAAKRQAYQADFGKAMGDEARGWEAHGNQVEAANGLRTAAMGGAPSQAAILGQQAAGQSLQAQLAAGANARGMGQAAAQMQAAQGVGQQQLGAVGQFAGMRGNEMHQAQGAYGQAGGAMRAGDYAQQGMAQQRADAQAQSEFAQRQLNQGAQMGYEQMGINHQQAQVDANLRRDAMQTQANADATAASDARTQRAMDTGVGLMKAVGTFGAGSDERMKQSVVPLYEDAGAGVERHWDRDVSKAKPDVTSGASLSGSAPEAPKSSMAKAAMKQRGPSDDDLKRMADDMLATHKAQHSAQLAEGPSVRDHQQPPAWLQREMEPQTMLSDDRTKLAAAWDEGHAAAVSDIGKLGKMPGAALKQRQEPVAAAVRGVKADAWDEGHRAPPARDMGQALEQGFKPFEYEYKPGFAEQEGQQAGEKNVGPMAQDMAKNPVTGSAVKQGPDGLLMVDIPKATKVNSAGIGYLAAKQRKLEEEMASMKGGR